MEDDDSNRVAESRTLAGSVVVEGAGTERVTLRPNTRADGIWFVHEPSGLRIPAQAACAQRVDRMTQLVGDGVRIRRVEHLLSALAGLGVEHARLDIASETVPLLDGSAARWVAAIDQAGTVPLAPPRRVLTVQKLVELHDGNRWIRVSPRPQFAVRYTLDYPGLPVRSLALTLDPPMYRRELASSRTFCGEHEAREVLVAESAALDGVVVYDCHGRADRPLRFADEAVRHKLLDLVGDLALVGRPVRGFIDARASGHALHIELARKLASAA